ncbi:putative neutral/alkaline nonlysosomal ceramidase [Talaromyces proteolyticus]|uniref:Neutral ceramidase n=1 Tax=Talaromyces proteolyticus TaxID=1131652 RepID=A0AAD4KPM2_9EURO|nr:putative neutral/alkaline nonlysosomal ceramidase [Talaromyces proteolyticus]KAH8696415.1 putative neutral/alkaline nonlysosomal ceramidase [Talaromyces proteolyticus]
MSREYRDIQKRATDGSTFLVGVGKADITGPVAEVPLVGMGNSSQIGTGLRQRIFARTFIFADPANATNTWIYTVLDNQSGDTAIRHGIVQGLASLGEEYSQYGQHNVAITGTHSHSGPGGWHNYLLVQISTLGFNQQSYEAIVEGTLLSITRAHESLSLSKITVASTEIVDGNINRSGYSYLANPAFERDQYEYDTDKTMTLLVIDRISDNKTTGVLSFYSVHGTSNYNNNTLVTGDNKGVAAYLFERSVSSDARFADGFVAGFSQSSVGDTSPNVLGAFCEDTGLPCRFEDSTCNGKTELCQGRGPYFQENDNGAKSCFEIGRRQYVAAADLYNQMALGTALNATQITGSASVASFHTYNQMSGFQFTSPFNGSTLSTCYSALGYPFAGGTSDGPGAFDFTQNNTNPEIKNPFWRAVSGIVHKPSPQQVQCQAPKNIFLDLGLNTFPYAWAPDIVDVQGLRIGQLIIIVSPSEVTTMSGRRWKGAVSQAAQKLLSLSDPIVVLGSPANSYSHYVTTEEEYNVQRYEGASTIFGPNQLAAYVNLSLTYLPYLDTATQVVTLPPLPAGPSPPINTNNSLSFIPGVVYDNPPTGYSFGDVLYSSPTNETYSPGDSITVAFVGANPRNDLRLEDTYAAVEMKTDSGDWIQVRDDTDWNLKYEWVRTNTVVGSSEVTLTWHIEDPYYLTGWSQPLRSGTYRLHYYGNSKNILGAITFFEGVGPVFEVDV